ncbi:LOW QUALITY PROTEIN: hypothetical protein HID58_035237 [Brassica napus]|uniref:Uncharacterized protein n=1 Tax=Brassica napus TaxID=3708 RepID=A0ABQ8C6F1_BRANA|nr:LOW QUALITY PROTEIN: hypothetical protein HID58_035237 [Brassica napus]
MESFMAVFAVSGSVVFVASQFHKRLLSDYLDKFELEIRSPENAAMKKKVRFAADVVEPSGNNKDITGKCCDEEEGEIRGGCGGAVGK